MKIEVTGDHQKKQAKKSVCKLRHNLTCCSFTSVRYLSSCCANPPVSAETPEADSTKPQ